MTDFGWHNHHWKCHFPPLQLCRRAQVSSPYLPFLMMDIWIGTQSAVCNRSLLYDLFPRQSTAAALHIALSGYLPIPQPVVRLAGVTLRLHHLLNLLILYKPAWLGKLYPLPLLPCSLISFLHSPPAACRCCSVHFPIRGSVGSADLNSLMPSCR